MAEVVLAWFGLLFGLCGLGAVFAVVMRFIREAGGGLR